MEVTGRVSKFKLRRHRTLRGNFFVCCRFVFGEGAPLLPDDGDDVWADCWGWLLLLLAMDSVH